MSSVVKVIELIAQSEKSWDDAAKNAVAEAAKTIKNIKSIWVDNQTAEVEGNRIVSYRLNVKVSFLVSGERLFSESRESPAGSTTCGAHLIHSVSRRRGAVRPVAPATADRHHPKTAR